jgi:hypothetical protein
MYFSFSDGREILKADMCDHCQLSTGGEHEEGCPLKYRRVEIAPEIKSAVRIFRIDENKDCGIAF